MGLWQKLRSFFKNITVEPAYLLFSLSQGLYIIVSSQLYLEKVCRVNLALGDEICDNIQQHKDEQVEVQKYVSTLTIYNRILQAVPSVIIALFAGSWSDMFGRKVLIMTSISGFVINNLVFIINTVWFYELKAEYLLFECLQDCTGGFVVFFMSVNAYMSDITAPEHRTKRIAFMSGLWPIGFNVGKALSGLIKTKLGFLYNFSLGMLFAMTAMCYVLVFVPDSIKIREERLEKENEGTAGGELVQETSKPPELTGSLWHRFSVQFKAFFNFTNIAQGFKAVFKKRPHGLRKYVLLVIFCFEMEMFINVGEWGNTYLYLRRQLEFTMGQYTRYSTVVGVIGIVAQYITIPILSEKLKLHDSTIVLLDISGCFIQTIIIAFATAEWMLYVSAIIAFLDATSFSMLRCMVSKHIAPDEVGKVLSVMGAIQSFIPIVSGPIFGLIYRSTVAIYPQTYLLILAGFFAIDWLVLLFINIGMRRITRVMEAERDELHQEHLKMDQKSEKEAFING